VNIKGARILVVGLGKSGLSVVRLLCEQGASVIVNDLKQRDALQGFAEEAEKLGAELQLGHHDPRLFTGVDQIVLSPGIPLVPALQAAEEKGVPIASEIELASWFIKGTIIGITGTNGKSTVTTLVGQMCKTSCSATFVGGNLGTPLSEVVGTEAAHSGGITVAELSSFQLERIDKLRVHVAALLNVSDDHLDRYSSFEHYAATKSNIFKGQQEDDFAVIPASDVLCRSLASRTKGRIQTFAGSDGDVRVVEGQIVDELTGLSFNVDDLQICGAHNITNACTAVLIARLVGIEKENIIEILRSFKGLPHRMELMGTFAGIRYFDDSKATNVGATVAALDGLKDQKGKVVLIAGGRHKGGDYLPIKERLKTLGRALVTIGEAAPLIEKDLEGSGIIVRSADSMESAVQEATALAQPGDAVLLAPACSSFDMFSSYSHRGELFQQAVRSLVGRIV